MVAVSVVQMKCLRDAFKSTMCFRRVCIRFFIFFRKPACCQSLLSISQKLGEPYWIPKINCKYILTYFTKLEYHFFLLSGCHEKDRHMWKVGSSYGTTPTKVEAPALKLPFPPGRFILQNQGCFRTSENSPGQINKQACRCGWVLNTWWLIFFTNW